MSGKEKVFLDTNLMIYAHTNIDLIKQQVIHQIIQNENTVISTQVLKETASVLHKKFKHSWKNILQVLNEMEQNSTVFSFSNSSTSIHNACQLTERYGFSFYDSLILASALESNCSVLFSEDLQHNQLIEGVVLIKNPL